MADSSSAILLHCTVCFEELNFTDRAPVVLPCGHTYICKQCSPRLKKCTQCLAPLFPAVENNAVILRTSSSSSGVFGIDNHHSSSSISSHGGRRGSWNRSSMRGGWSAQSPRSVASIPAQPTKTFDDKEREQLPTPQNKVLMSILQSLHLAKLDKQKNAALGESQIEDEELRMFQGSYGTYVVSNPKGLILYTDKEEINDDNDKNKNTNSGVAVISKNEAPKAAAAASINRIDSEDEDGDVDDFASICSNNTGQKNSVTMAPQSKKNNAVIDENSALEEKSLFDDLDIIPAGNRNDDDKSMEVQLMPSCTTKKKKKIPSMKYVSSEGDDYHYADYKVGLSSSNSESLKGAEEKVAATADDDTLSLPNLQPLSISSSIDDEEEFKAPRRKIIPFRQTVQIISFQNGIAKLPRGAGYLKASPDQDLKKIGDARDEGTKIEGQLISLLEQREEMQSKIRQMESMMSNLTDELCAFSSREPFPPIFHNDVVEIDDDDEDDKKIEAQSQQFPDDITHNTILATASSDTNDDQSLSILQLQPSRIEADPSLSIPSLATSTMDSMDMASITNDNDIPPVKNHRNNRSAPSLNNRDMEDDCNYSLSSLSWLLGIESCLSTSSFSAITAPTPPNNNNNTVAASNNRTQQKRSQNNAANTPSRNGHNNDNRSTVNFRSGLSGHRALNMIATSPHRRHNTRNPGRRLVASSCLR